MMQNLPLLNTSNAAPKAHTQGASKSGNITGQSSEAGSFQQKLSHQIHQKSERQQQVAQNQQSQQAQQNQQTPQKSEPAEDKTIVDKDASAADLIQRKIKGMPGKLALPEINRQNAGRSNPDEIALDAEDTINVVDGTLIPASLNVLAQLQQAATKETGEQPTQPAIDATQPKTDDAGAKLIPAAGNETAADDISDSTKPAVTGLEKLAQAAGDQRTQAEDFDSKIFDSSKFDSEKFNNAKFDSALSESLNKTAPIKEPVASMLQSQPVSVAQTAAANLANTNLVNNSLIMTPPGKEGWSQAIGQRVMWMVGAAQQSATLTLNPPEMGPLQIVINVHNDTTDAAFFSDRQEVRQALQDGMDNLRDMMKEAGINLGQTNINQRDKMAQDFTQQQQQAAHQDTGNSAQTARESSVSTTPTRAGLGLVDTFA